MSTRTHLFTLVVFDDCDLLDVGGPYEVLLTADRVAAADACPDRFRVEVASTHGQPVTAYGGLGLVPTTSVSDATDRGGIDWLVVPGSIDIDAALADAELVAAIRRLATDARQVASVCTGALLLAQSGLLDGVSAATTHHEDVGLLAARIGEDRARLGPRWVDAGGVVTAAGLSSGIAMALHLVARIAGHDLALRTAAKLEYDWDPEAGIEVASADAHDGAPQAR